MEEEQLLHARAQSDVHRVIHAAVAPAGVRLVFLGVVLRIQDEHIRATDELDDFLIFVPCVGQRLGRGRFAGPGRAHPQERLVVRQIRDRAA